MYVVVRHGGKPKSCERDVWKEKPVKGASLFKKARFIGHMQRRKNLPFPFNF